MIIQLGIRGIKLLQILYIVGSLFNQLQVQPDSLFMDFLFLDLGQIDPLVSFFYQKFLKMLFDGVIGGYLVNGFVVKFIIRYQGFDLQQSRLLSSIIEKCHKGPAKVFGNIFSIPVLYAKQPDLSPIIFLLKINFFFLGNILELGKLFPSLFFWEPSLEPLGAVVERSFEDQQISSIAIVLSLNQIQVCLTSLLWCCLQIVLNILT